MPLLVVKRLSLGELTPTTMTLQMADRSLAQPEGVLETIVPINFELEYDFKIQSSMNENEMNFQYLKDIDFEFLNYSIEFKKTILSPNEGSAKNSSNCEGKAQEVETIFEELILKEITQTFEVCLLRS